jgi:osmoprotectant transport system permease protein
MDLIQTLQQALEYILDPRSRFLDSAATHLKLSGLAMLFALLVGVPAGIWVSYHDTLARIAINVVGVLRVLPSLAVLFLLLPSQGIGFRPAAIALTILAIPPLFINAHAGIKNVDPAIVEAGRGMGMSRRTLLYKVQIPLALPVMLGGLRIAAVEVIASATLATLIGGGGLGDIIAAGLSLNRPHIILAGAIPVATLALASEAFLSYIQRLALRFALPVA